MSYDEDNTCVHCDNDPCACFEPKPVTSVQRLLNIINNIQGIESARLVNLPPQPDLVAVLRNPGDVQAEFDAWMETTDGKFAQYRAEKGCR